MVRVGVNFRIIVKSKESRARFDMTGDEGSPYYEPSSLGAKVFSWSEGVYLIVDFTIIQRVFIV